LQEDPVKTSRSPLGLARAPFLPALLFFALCAPAFAGTADPFEVPDDFELKAVFGGRAPWTTRGVLTVKADGKCYSRKYKSDGSKVLHEENFTLHRDRVATLYCASLQSGFFLLPKNHDGSASGGSFCSLRIQGGGRSRGVDTANISVPQLDELCRFINTLVPEKCRIFYNQIVGGDPRFTLAVKCLDEGLPVEDLKTLGMQFRQAVKRNLKENWDSQYYPFPNGMRGTLYRFHKWEDKPESVPAVITALLAPMQLRFRLAAPAELRNKHLRKPDGEGGAPVPGMVPRRGLVPLEPPEGYAWTVSPDGSYLMVLTQGDPGFTEGIVEKAEPVSRPGALKVTIGEAWRKSLARWLESNPGHRVALARNGKIVALAASAKGAPEHLEFESPEWSGWEVSQMLDVFKAGLVARGLFREVSGTWGYLPGLNLFVRNLTLCAFPPLNAGTVDTIKKGVSKALDPTPLLWFVEIRRESMTVYGEPEGSAGRLRSGRAVFLGAGEGVEPTVSSYVQVPKKGEKPSSRFPVATEMPFHAKGDIPETELVAIVDFIRKGPGKTFGEGEDALKVTLDTSKPILSVNKVGDRVVVRTGVEYGPKLGAGQILTLRKAGDTYEVLDLRWWWY